MKDGNVDVNTRLTLRGLAERFKTGDQIGSGGMCLIREAFDANLLRTGAAKMLRPDLADNREAIRRLIEEAQITAQLDHPNIVPVHELAAGEKGEVFFTMKLVRGRTLTEVLRAEDPRRRPAEGLFRHLLVFLKVCDAVSFAHSHGVLHCDLKPENVMVGEFGAVYVMDWGISRIKERKRPSGRDREMPRLDSGEYPAYPGEGMILGTPGYLSPEHARGKPLDERSDVFSLGGILYEILTNHPPVFGDSAEAVLEKTVRCRITPPQDIVDFPVPARLGFIAMKALSKRPKDRYQSVSELREDVENFLHSGWRFPQRDYPAGSLIVKEGEEGDEAYIITRGRCRVFKQVDGEKVVLRDLVEGKVFGETAVFSDKPRTASVEAMGDVSVRVVSREYIEEELGMGFWLGVFVQALAGWFREVDSKATRLERETEDSRIAISAFEYLYSDLARNAESMREVKWSKLLKVLRKRTGLREKDIAASLDRTAKFEVDTRRDVLVVKEP
jgi:CRP-like cAMP-binding protein/tRNA A-37 threonylcarbamoyl transferase component Bud32